MEVDALKERLPTVYRNVAVVSDNTFRGGTGFARLDLPMIANLSGVAHVEASMEKAKGVSGLLDPEIASNLIIDSTMGSVWLWDGHIGETYTVTIFR